VLKGLPARASLLVSTNWKWAELKVAKTIDQIHRTQRMALRRTAALCVFCGSIFLAVAQTLLRKNSWHLF
jgi:hypothetical protein